MPRFGITAAAAASPTAAFDAIEVTEPGTGMLKVARFNLVQTSDQGDANAEQLAVSWIVGHTTSGSGGQTTNIACGNSLWDAADTFAAEALNTTIASSGTTRTPYFDGWQVLQPWKEIYTPEEWDELMCLRDGQRGVLRVSAPADAITVWPFAEVIQE